MLYILLLFLFFWSKLGCWYVWKLIIWHITSLKPNHSHTTNSLIQPRCAHGFVSFWLVHLASSFTFSHQYKHSHPPQFLIQLSQSFWQSSIFFYSRPNNHITFLRNSLHIHRVRLAQAFHTHYPVFLEMFFNLFVISIQ